MADPVITNVDVGQISIGKSERHQEVFTAGGAATYPAGTLLARNTASGKMVPWEDGGAGGNGVAMAVLEYDVVAAGAGDLTVSALVAGVVNGTRLREWNGGTPIATNIDKAVFDQLRNYGIVPHDVEQLSVLDNQ